MQGIQSNTFMLIVLLLISVWAGAMVLFLTNSPSGSTGAVSAPDRGADAGGQLAANGQVQDIYVKALGTGFYDKTEVTVKKGIPVRFHFSAAQNAGCGRYIILDGFNKTALSKSGEDKIMEFTPTKAGRYPYHCGMNMFRGTLVVV